MHPKIESLLQEAETRYLKQEEIDSLKQYAISMVQSLKAYEFLREQEVKIFQPIADQLVTVYPEAPQEILERSLKQWLLILRYCGMAMLLNDAQYLQDNLLEWLQEIVKTHQSNEIELKIYDLLETRLKKEMTPQAMALLEPFLKQSKNLLIAS